MVTQLDLEKQKKQAGHSDVKTVDSQVLFPLKPNKKLATDLIANQVFCSSCEGYHEPNAKLRCALNRAIRKIGERTLSHEQKKATSQV